MRTKKQYLKDLEAQEAQRRRNGCSIAVCALVILGCIIYMVIR
jgi:hypothetical protein